MSGPGRGRRGAVVTRRTDLCTTPARYGRDGGYGTSAHLDPRVFADFWTSAYRAIDD